MEWLFWGNEKTKTKKAVKEVEEANAMVVVGEERTEKEEMVQSPLPLLG